MVAIIKPYREAEFKSGMGFSGHVTMKLVDRNGRVTRETEFKNLITDYFLDNGFAGCVLSNRTDRYYDLEPTVAVAVGDGPQVAPQPTDTGLANPIAAKTTFVKMKDSTSGLHVPEGWIVLGETLDQDYLSLKAEATFDFAEANGDLTEIGMLTLPGHRTVTDYEYADPASTQTRLLAKALIKDDAGNPIVFSKTSGEQLIVSYEIRFYRPTEAEATFTLGGESKTFKFLTCDRNTPNARDTDSTYRGVLDRDLLAEDVAQGDWSSAAPLDYAYGTSFIGGSFRYSTTGNQGQPGTSGLTTLLAAPKASIGIVQDSAGGAVNAYNFNLPGRVFEGYARILPDVSDRTFSQISRALAAFHESAAPTNPRSGDADIRTLTNAGAYTGKGGALVCIDAATGLVTEMVLPANYRLDFALAFERKRV